MPLARLHAPFDHPEWLFELKYDGFRSLAYGATPRATASRAQGAPDAAPGSARAKSASRKSPGGHTHLKAFAHLNVDALGPTVLARYTVISP